ncbi:MAG: adenylosuccinate synthase [Rhodobacteraceae bacterium]|nr:adenylosuccinate synthase [Paracoccaceae bacterium]
MNITVAGIQWGDEGKGKIVDWLCGRFDVVVRFQGGNNAGHTLVAGDETYKLSNIPSGILHRGKLNVIGGGTVLDPVSLRKEVRALRDRGVAVSPENLAIADNVPLLLSVHRELDRLRETAAGKGKIGTTLRGIGPAYEDKIGRRAIRLCDLSDPEGIPVRVDTLLRHHNALRRGMGAPLIGDAAICDEILQVADWILPFAQPVWKLLHNRQEKGERILFEGAQGALLDIDHGTYPFVTSSSTLPGGIATGAGVGPDRAGHVLGVCKAYTTRVGAGPFPTELFDTAGQRIASRGAEKGTVTGRNRRCGWFDAALVRQICTISGVDSLALTKIDVLDGMDEIKICVGYRLGSRRLDHMPPSTTDQQRLEPIWESVPGWQEATEGVREIGGLPAGALNYIRRLQDITGVPIDILSTSARREDIVLINQDWKLR